MTQFVIPLCPSILDPCHMILNITRKGKLIFHKKYLADQKSGYIITTPNCWAMSVFPGAHAALLHRRTADIHVQDPHLLSHGGVQCLLRARWHRIHDQAAALTRVKAQRQRGLEHVTISSMTIRRKVAYAIVVYNQVVPGEGPCFIRTNYPISKAPGPRAPPITTSDNLWSVIL